MLILRDTTRERYPGDMEIGKGSRRGVCAEYAKKRTRRFSHARIMLNKGVRVSPFYKAGGGGEGVGGA